MKNNFKFLIVLTILLAGCICIGSTFAADSDITVTDVSIDNTQQNIEIAHDDSSQNEVEITNNLAKEDSNINNLRLSDSDVTFYKLPEYTGINENVNITINFTSIINGTATLFIDGDKKSDTSFNKTKRLNLGMYSFSTLGNHNITVNVTSVDGSTGSVSKIISVRPYAAVTIVNISNIQYGDYLSFNVTFPNDTVGTIRIFLDGDTVFALGENSTITGGVTSFSVRNTGKLTVGNHSIVAKLTKSNVYADSISESVNFTVSQKIVNPSDMSIEQYDPALKYGDNGIYIKFNFKVTGNVILVSDGQNISSTFVNDSDRVSFKNITLEPGRHNVSFIFEGNENYSSQSIDSINIMCVPIITPVVIGGHENRTAGEPIKIIVDLYPNTTGRFDLVYSNGTIFSSKNLVNDSHFEFDDFTLSMGTHKLNILYYGLSDNSTVTNNITIYVTEKANLTVNSIVNPAEIKLGESTDVTVSLSKNVTSGNVTLYINGSKYETKDITGSSVVFNIGNDVLSKLGKYNIVAEFSGNDQCNNASSGIETLTVNQLQTTVAVDPVKGKAGQKVTITARVTDENGNPVNEGTVIIGFNGKEYEAQVVDGIATVEVVLPDKAGTYSATAYYEGFNYNSSYATFTVEVSDIPGPNPDPNPNPVNPGNMENTGNPLLVLLIALVAIGLESLRRKF